MTASYIYIYIRSPVSVFLFFLSTVIFSLIFVLSRPFFLLNAINLSNRSLYTPLHPPSLYPFLSSFSLFFPALSGSSPPLFPTLFLFLFLFTGARLQSGALAEIKISTRDTAIRRVWPECRVCFKSASSRFKGIEATRESVDSSFNGCEIVLIASR